MDIFGIGSAVGGIAGAVGTAKASLYNLLATRETNLANRELAELENKWNLELWNRENLYNSPAAKLARMEAAGLNPLFYGLEGANTASHLESANLDNLIAPLLDAGAIGSSLNNLTSSLVSAGELLIQNRNIDLRNRELDLMEDELNNVKKPTAESNVSLNEQKREESQHVISLLDANTEKLKSEKNLTDLEVENAKKSHELMEAQRLKTTEEYEGVRLDNDQKKIYLKYAEEMVAADLNVKQSEAKNLLMSAYYYITAGDKAAAEEAGLKLENELTETYGHLDHLGSIVGAAASALSKVPGLAKKLPRLLGKLLFKNSVTGKSIAPVTGHKNPNSNTYKRGRKK